MTSTPSTLRLDKKCGASGIPENATCHKSGSAGSEHISAAKKALKNHPSGALFSYTSPASPSSAYNRSKKAVAIGGGAALAAIGAVGLAAGYRRHAQGKIHVTDPSAGGPSPDPWDAPFTPRSPRPSSPPRPESPRVLPGDRTTRRLTGLTPRGLLPPGKPPKSKTQRMRENTAAAQAQARAAVAQTGREEVRRIAQIGNTMATTGEATGMTMKTTLRELRLRAEAARRRWEPGYRRGNAARKPAQLPESTDPPVSSAFNPIQRPEPVPVNPTTGLPQQPHQRRSRARGFGRTDSPWAIGFSESSPY